MNTTLSVIIISLIYHFTFDLEEHGDLSLFVSYTVWLMDMINLKELSELWLRRLPCAVWWHKTTSSIQLSKKPNCRCDLLGGGFWLPQSGQLLIVLPGSGVPGQLDVKSLSLWRGNASRREWCNSSLPSFSLTFALQLRHHHVGSAVPADSIWG